MIQWINNFLADYLKVSSGHLDKEEGSNVLHNRFIGLLLRAEDRILRHLEDAELNHGSGGNLDLLFR
jgi:hypothetical protein